MRPLTISTVLSSLTPHGCLLLGCGWDGKWRKQHTLLCLLPYPSTQSERWYILWHFLQTTYFRNWSCLSCFLAKYEEEGKLWAISVLTAQSWPRTVKKTRKKCKKLVVTTSERWKTACMNIKKWRSHQERIWNVLGTVSIFGSKSGSSSLRSAHITTSSSFQTSLVRVNRAKMWACRMNLLRTHPHIQLLHHKFKLLAILLLIHRVSLLTTLLNQARSRNIIGKTSLSLGCSSLISRLIWWNNGEETRSDARF